MLDVPSIGAVTTDRVCVSQNRPGVVRAGISLADREGAEALKSLRDLTAQRWHGSVETTTNLGD